MGMRIGIVGTQCVGKTTLAKDLSKEINSILIEEQIRVSNRKFSVLGYQTLDQIVASTWYSNFMFDILINQVQKEVSAKSGFVSDRTTLDYYAYYELLSCDSPEVQQIIKELFLPRLRDSYDLIFYLPITFELVNDGYRHMDYNLQHQADIRIQELLRSHQNVVPIHAYTPKERLDKALEMIQIVSH